MEIKRVGVVGFGIMGTGIVQALAQGGYHTTVFARSDGTISRGMATINSILSKRMEKGKISQHEKESVVSHITGSTNTDDLSKCDLVIEAINEDLETKKSLFILLDQVCLSHTILATNTSCLSVTDIAMATKRPEKVLGMHFHNPAPIMKLLELVRTIVAAEETIGIARKFGESLGKTVVVTPDVCGFVVTRLFTPFLLGAVRMLEEGIASRDDIDVACKLALNHPMGPLEVIDFIGLDTELAVDEMLYKETKDAKYAAPALLRKMVTAGWLGRKTGKGFYDYTSHPKR